MILYIIIIIIIKRLLIALELSASLPIGPVFSIPESTKQLRQSDIININKIIL